MADIQQAVRVALAKLDMNQTELAEKMEATPQQVSRWVSGDGDIKVETANRIAATLGMKLSELVALGE